MSMYCTTSSWVKNSSSYPELFYMEVLNLIGKMTSCNRQNLEGFLRGVI